MNKIKLVGMLIFGSIVMAISEQSFAVESDNKTAGVNDGPYIIFDQKELSASWLCQGKVSRISVSVNALPHDFKQCGLSAKVNTLVNLPEALIYQGDYQVAALSDLHGQYDLMIKLLTNNKIIDQQGNWDFDNGHFVITGDIFDRGDKVTEILWFLYKLERQAEQAGGKLHLLLGNHEVMILNGDLRYLHPKYIETALKLNQPFEQLFSANTVLGAWLRNKPVLVKVNNMLFAHGGFHPGLAKEKRSLPDINRVFKQNLVKAELNKPRSGWGKYLHKTDGPIWYRGYFKDDGATAAEIELLLKHFDVDYLVVGHTSHKTIKTRYQGKVIAIDSSIKNGEYGEILLIDGAQKWRGSLSGKPLALD